MPRAIAWRGEGGGNVGTVQQEGACITLVDAKEEVDKFGASGTDQATYPENLAFAYLEGDVFHYLSPSIIADLERHPANWNDLSLVVEGRFAADHVSGR